LGDIPFESLQKTFKDAVTVTHQLGFRYLWIDSLCIIQDSVADWEQECVNRIQIYQNSTVTVAGPAAANSDAGFLDRPSRANYPAYTFSYELPDRKGMYCAQKAGVRRIDCGSTAYYLFYLGSELILIDIRKPYRVPVSYDIAGLYELRCTGLRIATKTQPIRNTLKTSKIY
jgi:hypothetical protein